MREVVKISTFQVVGSVLEYGAGTLVHLPSAWPRRFDDAAGPGGPSMRCSWVICMSTLVGVAVDPQHNRVGRPQAIGALDARIAHRLFVGRPSWICTMNAELINSIDEFARS